VLEAELIWADFSSLTSITTAVVYVRPALEAVRPLRTRSATSFCRAQVRRDHVLGLLAKTITSG